MNLSQPIRTRSVFTLVRCTALATVWLASTSTLAAWEENVNYGAAGGPRMDLYIPDNVDAAPGIVVSLHYCTGTSSNAQQWFEGPADQYGFLVIAPDAPGSCWNASPGREGERAAIVQMVEYALAEHGADPSKVFAAGASSGACMTNTLLGSYPEVFAAGAVLAGVPVGFWPSGTECSVCSQNPPDNSAEVWGDYVRNASPDFTGSRPRVQLWHGTADTTLPYSNLAQEIKQWTNALELNNGPGPSESVSGGWERTSYADDAGAERLQVNIGEGKVHDLTQYNPWEEIVLFFGLDQDAAPEPPDAGGNEPGGFGGSSEAGSAGAAAEPAAAAGGTPGAAGAASPSSTTTASPTATVSPTPTGSSSAPVPSATVNPVPTVTSPAATTPLPATAPTTSASATAAPVAPASSSAPATVPSSSGSAAEPSGSLGAGGANTSNAASDSGGCAYRVPQSSGSSSAFALLAASLLAVVRRRRRPAHN